MQTFQETRQAKPKPAFLSQFVTKQQEGGTTFRSNTILHHQTKTAKFPWFQFKNRTQTIFSGPFTFQTRQVIQGDPNFSWCWVQNPIVLVSYFIHHQILSNSSCFGISTSSSYITKLINLWPFQNSQRIRYISSTSSAWKMNSEH